MSSHAFFSENDVEQTGVGFKEENVEKEVQTRFK